MSIETPVNLLAVKVVGDAGVLAVDNEALAVHADPLDGVLTQALLHHLVVTWT